MLVGKYVLLEEIDHSNIEWMRHQRNKPEMRQYFREWKDISKEQQERWYSGRGNNLDPNHVYFQIMALPRVDGCGPLVITDEEFSDLAKNVPGTEELTKEESIDQRVLIGCCNLSYVDWRLRAAEFGIFISKEARGKGLGKEALIMLCDYGFKEMNLHKIWAEVYDGNDSIHLYRKIGFRDDGKLRHNAFINGHYIDSTVMSVLDHEWFEKYGN